MRSVFPNNTEWPHGMVIGIGTPNELLELLWIRDAWRLSGKNDVPPLAATPAAGHSAPPNKTDLTLWASRWDQEWTSALALCLQNSTSAVPRLSQPAQRVRWWHETYGWEGVDRDAYESWLRAQTRDALVPLQETPERRALPTLRRAWQEGLSDVIELPVQGYWAHRVSRSHLLVSSGTRHEPGTYGAALSLPIEPMGRGA